MREFTVKRGKFEGKHKIYNDAKELEKDLGISFVRKPWHSDDTKVGEWCEMDDGFIAQCLDRYELVSKSGGVVYVYRFAFGSKVTYYRKDGTKRTPLFYTVFPSAKKNSLVESGYSTVIGGQYKTDPRKRLWAQLIVDGVEPFEATRTVYKEAKKSQIVDLTIKLIDNEKLRKYIMNKLVPFKQHVDEKVSEATGLTLKEAIANTIATLVTTDPKSIKDITTKLKTLIDVGKITGDIVSEEQKSKLAKANEASFTEVEPPQLGASEE